MSYTKGSWSWINGKGLYSDENGDDVLTVEGDPHSGSVWIEVDEEDANLIAAAPDMYEALKLARKRLCIACGLCDGEGEKVCGNVAKIDAALAKAEGREVNDG